MNLKLDGNLTGISIDRNAEEHDRYTIVRKDVSKEELKGISERMEII